MPSTRSSTTKVSGTVILEESFAPELKEDMKEASVAISKRFVASTGIKRNRAELEKENLHQIIFHTLNSDDDDDSDDNDSKNWTEHNTRNNAEERIHYLKLDLANAKLETQELKEKVDRLQMIENTLTHFEKSIVIIEGNIQHYKALYMRAEGGAQFANLIRDEITQIKPKPTIIIPKTIILGNIKQILEMRFDAYLKAEEDHRIKFHNKIQYEQNKRAIIWIVKIIVFLILILLIIRKIQGWF